MVNRQTLTANAETNFNFDNQASEFVVKNFTTDYIIVCSDSYTDSKGYKIPSMTAQTIKFRTKKLVIKSYATGEVEVDA